MLVWGKGIFETEEWLQETMGHEVKSLSIGPAGENIIPFACIGSEAYRQMGRGGAGSLFGSKKLKAIACTGSGGVQVADMGVFLEKVADATDSNLLTEGNLWAKNHGTPMLVEVTNEMGIHPTRNYTQGVNPRPQGTRFGSHQVHPDRRQGLCILSAGLREFYFHQRG